MDNILRLISLTRKAGKLEVGEEPTGAAARAHQAKLIIVAKDATENTYRRVHHFGDIGNTTWVSVPYTKAELGGAVGRATCAMMAVMDMGLAAAIVRGLAKDDPEKFKITTERMDAKAERTLQRQREKRQHEKNLRSGKYQAEQQAKALAEEQAAAKQRKEAAAARKEAAKKAAEYRAAHPEEQHSRDDHKPYDGKKPHGGYGDRKPYGDKKTYGDRKPYGDKKPYGSRNGGSHGDQKPYGDKKTYGDRKPYGGQKSYGDKKPYGSRNGGSHGDQKPYGDKKPYGDRKPYGGQKPYGGKKPYGDQSANGGKQGGKTANDRVYRGNGKSGKRRGT